MHGVEEKYGVWLGASLEAGDQMKIHRDCSQGGEGVGEVRCPAAIRRQLWLRRACWLCAVL